MTTQAEESKHVTPEMCAVLRYTAEHGCMAKVGEPWLGPARLLERQGLIVLWRCLGGHYAARLTPAGAEVPSVRGRYRELGSPRFNGVNQSLATKKRPDRRAPVTLTPVPDTERRQDAVTTSFIVQTVERTSEAAQAATA